jgi:hypothetical protein
VELWNLLTAQPLRTMVESGQLRVAVFLNKLRSVMLPPMPESAFEAVLHTGSAAAADQSRRGGPTAHSSRRSRADSPHRRRVPIGSLGFGAAPHFRAAAMARHVQGCVERLFVPQLIVELGRSAMAARLCGVMHTMGTEYVEHLQNRARPQAVAGGVAVHGLLGAPSASASASGQSLTARQTTDPEVGANSRAPSTRALSSADAGVARSVPKSAAVGARGAAAEVATRRAAPPPRSDAEAQQLYPLVLDQIRRGDGDWFRVFSGDTWTGEGVSELAAWLLRV